MYWVKKSTLGEINHGICGTKNNSRYTGKTVAWAVWSEECEKWPTHCVIAVDTKKICQAMVDHFNEINFDYVTKDPELTFIKGTNITEFKVVG